MPKYQPQIQASALAVQSTEHESAHSAPGQPLTRASNQDHSLQQSKALAWVEMRQATNSSSCYTTHSHDEFSLGIIDSGEAYYKNGQHQHKITQGDLVTINPGDAHSCNPFAGSWSYRMLFIDSDWLSSLQQQTFILNNHDSGGFAQHYLKGVQVEPFNQLYQALKVDNSPMRCETLLIEYCLPLLGQDVIAEASASSHKMGLLKDYIIDSLELNLPLSDYCQQLDLSPHHLIRSFKKYYGQSPHAFQLDQRIKRSRQLLKQGEGLAEIANQLGFADQSHFQRNFKQRTAVTPKFYQRSFQ